MTIRLVHDLGDYILAVYYIETEKPLGEVAEKIASMETTGEWIGKSKPTELFHQCHGKVYSVEEIEKGKGYVHLLFPLKNINLDEAPFTGLWLSMVGGPAFAMIDYTKSRLCDFAIPEYVLKYFAGPFFGINGTRKYLGLEKNDPLIGTIVKPTSGLTPEEVARMCYEAALGGVVFIKDDEKMINPKYCPLAERVKLVVENLRKAEEQTGQKVLYAPHISTGPERILDNARIALENGANALMLNFFGSGFGSLDILAKSSEINVPIYAHCGGRSAMARAEGQGIDQVVIAKFSRLLGGDYFRLGILGGYLIETEDILRNLATVCREPLPEIKDTVPVLSGGLGPKNLVENLQFFGIDVLALAGSKIFSHPMGTKAGVLAMKQAAESFLKNIPLSRYAANHKELQVALES